MKTIKFSLATLLMCLSLSYSPDSLADGGTAYFDTSFDAYMYCSDKPNCTVTKLSNTLYRASWSDNSSSDDPGTGGSTYCERFPRQCREGGDE